MEEEDGDHLVMRVEESLGAYGGLIFQGDKIVFLTFWVF